MEKPIRHLHVRTIHAPLPRVVATIDALWSRGADDAFPRALGGWRRTPAGKRGMAVGTRFGHGPFSFTVEEWDGRTLRARIETRGFRGHHGFTLREEGADVVVTHDLDAMLDLPQWLVWNTLVATGHDWAVETVFDRMQELLGESHVTFQRPPRSLQAFTWLRKRLSV